MDKAMGIKEKLILPNGVTSQTQSLFNYWCTLGGQDLVPSRSDFRPAAVLPLLPNLMILEFRTDGSLVYRLVGTACVEKLGIDMTGSNLFDYVAPHQRHKAEMLTNKLRALPCGLIVHEKMRSKHKTPFVVELIYLPLRDRDGAVSQLIASATVLERGEKGTANGDERMIAISATYIDIGAGVPQQSSDNARQAV